MPVWALELCDNKGYTALHTAAWVGNTAAAMVLVQKRPNLLHIRGNRYRLPIHVRKDTLSYLLKATKDDPASKPYHGPSGIWLLMYVITSQFYDVALELIYRYPELATSKIELGHTVAKKVPAVPTSPLANLAAKVSSFRCGFGIDLSVSGVSYIKN
ncbi:uncharacterized protein LOC130789339 [Actinidia eriantha]|uniref:uncharacterized protein LOC130789339 n=1 Tax=Actinidia eriantha TaxID=165200 RepID=UPI00258D9CCA|nr:uncharacterized protein LOC130789339 [Actinidia eriantha]